MRWDIFCQVIDNFGDVGVCWRLARALRTHGQEVRLWLDDASALAWMAPWQPGEPAPEGIAILPWSLAADAADGGASSGPVAEVVIEAFGCHLPEPYVARMAAAGKVQWINLEYLSAEAYVERSHGLPSPVMSGPGAGMSKRFFYPGFTSRTGGLLQPQAMASAPGQRQALRAALLADLGTRAPGGTDLMTPQPAALDAPWVLAFCYPTAPLGAMLDALATSSRANSATAVDVWLTPGAATAMGQAWARTAPADNRLVLHALPHLPQDRFDNWLDACDLRLVRGEDSAVRALWSGRPHLWQLYEQDDGVHADKLHAFLDRWMQGWPQAERARLTAWWRWWNGLAGPQAPVEPLPNWLDVSPSSWTALQTESAGRLAAQTDLCRQLMAFVNCSG